ncbi:GyrI-like domain-containing protein [Kribbella qitaiheensis]|uniref:GyrI-like domain-containing protein n=1 Tax=Kribbella qitaiheensis TaxID=1544730 RepID=UPI00361734E6
MHTALIETRTLEAQPTAVRRAVLESTRLTDWLPTALVEVAEALRVRGDMPNGFPFARYQTMPKGVVAVEAGFPMPTPVLTDGLVQASSLPAGPVAVTMYVGQYDGIGTAHDLVRDWLRQRGARPDTEGWEVYHHPPTGDPDNWRTEIVQPYRLTTPAIRR